MSWIINENALKLSILGIFCIQNKRQNHPQNAKQSKIYQENLSLFFLKFLYILPSFSPKSLFTHSTFFFAKGLFTHSIFFTSKGLFTHSTFFTSKGLITHSTFFSSEDLLTHSTFFLPKSYSHALPPPNPPPQKFIHTLYLSP